MNCPKCRLSVPATSRFCLSCGCQLAGSSELETAAVSAPVTTSVPISSQQIDEGRYLPGVMLSGRYRIIALLGRGGMGEVYRATDIKLGQQVALKFLPESLSRDTRSLDRLYAEVRIARQIAHPNVCRVYDVGEVEGLAFISMEYVDGEDLSGLLRRIGRLPSVKATELAKQLCSGLAAAHDQNILHRDLKPSNIMLDARGQVRIMDFGLAVVASTAGDVRSGTPAYMAPEQLEGKEVSQQSDIYSLGLVLYEIFTGRRPFDAKSLEEFRREQFESTPLSLSSQVGDVDPAMERVIFRCLSHDPKDRPSSARSIIAAMPGGDPLAAAVAAGETPSPELVAAAAQGKDLIPLRWLLAAFATILIGLAVIGVLTPDASYFGRIRPELTPDAMTQRCRDLIQALGYPRPADTARGYEVDRDVVGYVQKSITPGERLKTTGNIRPGSLKFWYRESPWMLVPRNAGSEGETKRIDPPPLITGGIIVTLDSKGRLIQFEAIPPQLEEPVAGGIVKPDWTPLFRSADIDPSTFRGSEPRWNPLSAFDYREAWEGSFPESPGTPIRVEAASWRGKVVAFQVVAPWTRPTRMEKMERPAGQRLGFAAITGLAVLMLGAVLFFARYNLRQGRGDRRGAFRIASVIFVLYAGSRLLVAHHVPAIFEEQRLVVTCLLHASLFSILFYFLYLALEPPVRRRWPQSLVSWYRLVAGNWRDSLVGGHFLIGLAGGAVQTMIGYLAAGRLLRLGLPMEDLGATETAMGGMQIPHAWLNAAVVAAGTAMISLFALFLFRLIFRNAIAATVLFVACYAVIAGVGTGRWEAFLSMALITSLSVFLLVRFGILALAACSFFGILTRVFYLSWDTSTWFSGPGWITAGLLLGLTAIAFSFALGGRKLLSESLLDH